MDRAPAAAAGMMPVSQVLVQSLIVCNTTTTTMAKTCHTTEKPRLISSRPVRMQSWRTPVFERRPKAADAACLTDVVASCGQAGSDPEGLTLPSLASLRRRQLMATQRCAAAGVDRFA